MTAAVEYQFIVDYAWVRNSGSRCFDNKKMSAQFSCVIYLLGQVRYVEISHIYHLFQQWQNRIFIETAVQETYYKPTVCRQGLLSFEIQFWSLYRTWVSTPSLSLPSSLLSSAMRNCRPAPPLPPWTWRATRLGPLARWVRWVLCCSIISRVRRCPGSMESIQ